MCDVLVTVGVRAQFIREMAHKKRMKKKQMFHFDTSEKAGEFLKDFVEPNDVVLIKGSQSIRMEKAVKHILRSPGDSKFLVRQEKEWENH
jgi:UDP-N-acetylmuramyl pentapeptide synthase